MLASGASIAVAATSHAAKTARRCMLMQRTASSDACSLSRRCTAICAKLHSPLGWRWASRLRIDSSSPSSSPPASRSALIRNSWVWGSRLISRTRALSGDGALIRRARPRSGLNGVAGPRWAPPCLDHGLRLPPVVALPAPLPVRAPALAYAGLQLAALQAMLQGVLHRLLAVLAE